MLTLLWMKPWRLALVRIFSGILIFFLRAEAEALFTINTLVIQ